jgi:Zn-dependent protease with chaperone function
MSIQKAGRAAQVGVQLKIAGTAGSLALASGVTISLLCGIVLALCTALLFIVRSTNPLAGLGIAIAITIIFNLAVFFLAPFIMDLVQAVLYQTRWVPLAEIERRSPETARVINRVCRQKNINIPRLGIIDDQNPTAFTYGSLPSSARIVVSEGLFTYLDEDEVATVYAHELGHIVHWDFAVMTVASTLVQIAYLCYVAIREISRNLDNENLEKVGATLSLIAYVFYVIGNYLLLYLSRVREYFADHFAAEVTGNPNGLSRALVKIAYGIVTQTEHNKQPSRLLQGTRALGIYDAKAAMACGTAYQLATAPEQIGKVFLWDMFNPWGGWLELNSTHPLTGKRVRALSTYAEQLGLDTEFDMGRVAAEGRRLNRKRLYSNFFLDLALLNGEWLSAIAGGIIGALVFRTSLIKAYLALPLIMIGIVILIKRLIMYPSTTGAPPSDVLTLMSDPYASPVRGQPIQLQGTIVGRADAGYVFGSDLKLQDRTGMIYLLYTSRFGSLGNFLFGMTRVQGLIGLSARVKGWFRRGIVPWVDLELAETESRTKITSHPAFWALVNGALCLVIGVLLLVVLS